MSSLVGDWRRRRGERSQDPLNVGGRELLAFGWLTGLPVGNSLGWAIWAGHVEPVRVSLGLLATAATVVIVLGSDAFRRGSERGFGTPDRRVFGGTAVWVMVAGVVGVVLAAAALPWLGPAGRQFITRPGEAVFVGAVGFVLGVVLGAPIVLAASGATSRARDEGRSTEASPGPAHPAAIKARAGEFLAPAEDPYRHDTLGRREQVERFCERLLATETPVVWAVEGAWGTGKTAFSRMCAAVLRNRPDVAEVIPVNAQTQGVTGAPLVDLAVAVGRALELAARDQTDEPERRRRRMRLAELAEAASAPAVLLREFGRGDTPAADTVEEMARIVGEHADSVPGLVILWIDELDRCPPEYALGMLRAVRSICDRPGIATVLTINPDALEEAVLQMHGELDSAERYLRRFIDLRVPLAAPGADGFEQNANRLGFMRALYRGTSLGQILGEAPVAGVALESLVGDQSLSLRDLGQIVYHAAIACAALPEPPAPPDERPSGSRPTGRSDPARIARKARSDTLAATVTMAILRFTSPEKFRDFADRAWTSQESAHEFFRGTLAEAGRSFGHRIPWPAEELAASMATVATRHPDAGIRLEEIAAIVAMSGAPPPCDHGSTATGE